MFYSGNEKMRNGKHFNLISTWSGVLRSSKTSTLKYAVARALIETVKESTSNNDVVLTREALATRLVCYYWYQVRQFRLKQAAAEIQEPNVTRQLRALPDSYGLRWHAKTPEIKKIIEFVAEEGFREVIPRFHTGLDGRIFEMHGTKALRVTEAQRGFIATFESLLMRSVLGGWSAQVEQYNLTPRVYAKICFDGRRRTSVWRWAGHLRAHDNSCFYCGKLDPTPAHVDHVIPWSFLLDDPAWNLVLACDLCNSSKRDRIPAQQFLQRLCTRNQALTGGGAFENRVRFSLSQLPHRASDGLAISLNVLCQQAYLQGFGRGWHPSSGKASLRAAGQSILQ
ncbi:hypothetical protein EXV95_19130 [Acidovorax sp. JMULE5]|uniref:HNH endonuclease domain-containing protein n=1 Tax=Acidovorax sp. JMULE5 TaxID=2518343 RepID=UPI0015A3F9FC|nr:HNH endonuclease domain-containing protein [Acidovorax sp. JMULE5]QLA82563.1 hypothetical protein EXV95_19130 [Acidovorax sp. JMULE5]